MRKKINGMKYQRVPLHVLVEQNLMLLKLNVRKNLTDEVVVDHEEEELLITVQMEINHEIDTMEHVMLQVEDEMMMKK